MKRLQLRQTEAIFLDTDNLSFNVGKVKESSIKLEVVDYFGMVLLKIFPIENFVVFQIDLYFLVHFAQFYLNVEFSLLDKGLHIVVLPLCLYVSRKYDFLIASGGSVICNIGAIELFL